MRSSRGFGGTKNESKTRAKSRRHAEDCRSVLEQPMGVLEVEVVERGILSAVELEIVTSLVEDVKKSFFGIKPQRENLKLRVTKAFSCPMSANVSC